jgi:hypothetical protein
VPLTVNILLASFSNDLINIAVEIDSFSPAASSVAVMIKSSHLHHRVRISDRPLAFW